MRQCSGRVRRSRSPSSARTSRCSRAWSCGEKVGGFNFDQEMRWAIAIAAIALGLPIADLLLEEQNASTHPTAAGARCSRPKRRVRPAAAKESVAAHPRRWLRLVPSDARRDAGLLLAAADRGARAIRDPLLRAGAGVFARRDHPFARAPTSSRCSRPIAPSRSVLDRHARCSSSSTAHCPPFRASWPRR